MPLRENFRITMVEYPFFQPKNNHLRTNLLYKTNKTAWKPKSHKKDEQPRGRGMHHGCGSHHRRTVIATPASAKHHGQAVVAPSMPGLASLLCYIFMLLLARGSWHDLVMVDIWAFLTCFIDH